MVVAEMNGAPRPGTASDPSATAALTDSVAAPASGREGSTAQSVGPEPDSPIGRRRGERVRGGTAPAPARQGTRPQQVAFAAAMTPARARRSVADNPDPSSDARCIDVWRTAPSPDPRIAAKAAKTSGVETSDRWGHEHDPGVPRRPWSGVTRSPALDQRWAAGREERDVRTQAGRDSQTSPVVQLGAPEFQRAVQGSGCIRRATTQAGGDGDPLVEPGGDRRRGRRATGSPAAHGPAGRHERTQHECRTRSRLVRSGSRHVEGVRMGGGRQEAESVPSVSGAKTEAGRDSRPADDRSARVRFSFGRAIRRDRGPPVRDAAHASPERPRLSSPIGPIASRSASHSPTASVWGRRSGSMPAVAGRR
jgi:hypothetical protein